MRIVAVKATLARLKSLPRAITPLIFSAAPGGRLEDLLSDVRVKFDLDGFSDGRVWPWLKPKAGVLVWDPENQGRIVSGRQLFGTATWWMFWHNGFEPLAALDNNGDGWLSGHELDGIGVWPDWNGNGASDPGEVVTAREWGIVAIAVHSDALIDGALSNACGIKLASGMCLRVYDWTPHSGN